MSKFEDCTFSLSFTSTAEISADPENYLIRIEGQILCEDDEKDGILAGTLRLFYADLDEAVNNGYDHFYILDIHKATAPFYEVLFDQRTNEFKRSIYRQAGEDIYSHNLLILDRLEILPAFRGKCLGLVVLYRCMQQFRHGAGLIALKCFPLQFEDNSQRTKDDWLKQMKMDELGKDQRSCRSKLEKILSPARV